MEIEKQVSFIEEAERLKSVVRTAWTSEGRRESTAEHSWRLALLVWLMAEGNKELDLDKLLIMSLIHDMGEIYEGDISAALQHDKEEKYDTEYRAVKEVFSLLPEEQGDKLLSIWKEYNENATLEARLVKALDKAETIIQHYQGSNPKDFDYRFNLEYGKEYFEQEETLKQLRSMIDEKTKERC